MTDNAFRLAERAGEIDYGRQRGWFDPTTAASTPITIVGAGGIGSPLALALAKMGVPRLNIVDGDTVEKHNLPNQMFPLGSIGRPKVEVLAEEIARYSPTEVVTHAGFLEDDWPAEFGNLRGIVVLALDSIDVRRAIWERHLARALRVEMVVDPRLGGQNVVVYTADPRDRRSKAAYEETLHSAEESVPAPCTMRSIIDVGFSVSSLVTRAIRLKLAGEEPEGMLWWNHRDLKAVKS